MFLYVYLYVILPVEFVLHLVYFSIYSPIVEGINHSYLTIKAKKSV